MKSCEDVQLQRDLSVSILTDTELNVQTEKDIRLRYVGPFGPLSCTLEKISNSSFTDVTINDKPEPMAKIFTHKRKVTLKLCCSLLQQTLTLQVNLTRLSSIKCGQLNTIMIRTVTNYTLFSPAHGPCCHKTYPLFTTRINHYIHLYVFGKY